MTQREIRENVDLNTASKMLDLRFGQAMGPYSLSFTREGRYMVLGGAKGHLALIDLLRTSHLAEVHARETVRDVQALHNHSLFAVAQRKYVHVYDDQGTEVHVLRSHVEPHRLDFLPYHFLLATVGHGGWLKYQDVSTGKLVSEHRTKLGPCNVMRQKPVECRHVPWAQTTAVSPCGLPR